MAIKTGDVVILKRDVEMKQLILRAGAMGKVKAQEAGIFDVEWLLPRRYDTQRFGMFLVFNAQVATDEIAKATRAECAKIDVQHYA